MNGSSFLRRITRRDRSGAAEIREDGYARKAGNLRSSRVQRSGERYLEVEDHVLIEVAESCIRAGGGMTPAEIGEVLLRYRGKVDAAISEAVAEMQARARSSCGNGMKRNIDENWRKRRRE